MASSNLALHSFPLPQAEVSGELAPPPPHPMFCRVQLVHDAPTLCLLLHIQPSPHAATDLEVAVYSGQAVAAGAVEEGAPQGGAAAAMGAEGALYTLPHTAAAIDGFVQDLVETGSWQGEGEGSANSGPVYSLRLPDQSYSAAEGWREAQLNLLPPEQVLPASSGSAAEAEGSTPASGGNLSPCRVCLQFLLPWESGTPRHPAATTVRLGNPGREFAMKQGSQGVRQRVGRWEQAGSSAAGAGETSAGPAGEQAHQQAYDRLRQQTMHRLTTALASMVRQACRYRGECRSLPKPAAPVLQKPAGGTGTGRQPQVQPLARGSAGGPLGTGDLT